MTNELDVCGHVYLGLGGLCGQAERFHKQIEHDFEPLPLTTVPVAGERPLCVTCGHPEFDDAGFPIHLDESEPGGDNSDDWCVMCDQLIAPIPGLVVHPWSPPPEAVAEGQQWCPFCGIGGRGTSHCETCGTLLPPAVAGEPQDDVMDEVVICAVCERAEGAICAHDWEGSIAMPVHGEGIGFCPNGRHAFVPKRVQILRDWSQRSAPPRAVAGEDETAAPVGTFRISWDGSEYKVSIPNYHGGEVVPLAVYEAQLRTERIASASARTRAEEAEAGLEQALDMAAHIGEDLLEAEAKVSRLEAERETWEFYVEELEGALARNGIEIPSRALAPVSGESE